MAAALIAPATASGVELRDAVDAAQRHAQTKLDVDVRPAQTYAFRSDRDSDWVLVDGYGARARPWAVFLERGAGGDWVVRAGSAPAHEGPAGAPCDIRIPFSENLC